MKLKLKPRRDLIMKKAVAKTPAVVNMEMADTVDQLGRVKARIAPLVATEKDLKEQLYNVGPGDYEGKLFRATVSEVFRSGPDMEAMLAKLKELGVTQKWIDAHQKTTAYLAVTCKARTGKATAKAA